MAADGGARRGAAVDAARTRRQDADGQGDGQPGRQGARRPATDPAAGARGRRALAPSGTDGNRLVALRRDRSRSEEHTSELQSLMRSSYAVFCLKKKIISQYK